MDNTASGLCRSNTHAPRFLPFSFSPSVGSLFFESAFPSDYLANSAITISRSADFSINSMGEILNSQRTITSLSAFRLACSSPIHAAPGAIPGIPCASRERSKRDATLQKDEKLPAHIQWTSELSDCELKTKNNKIPLKYVI